jgi:hypothetical protein
MYQEVGETTKAIVEADEKKIEAILSSNKDRKEPYWIVIFAKPLKATVDGKPALIKVIKPYSIKPKSQVGLIVGEVDNARGTIKWEVNMPDRPFGYHLLGLEQDGCQVHETSIPDSYVYN